MFVELFLQVAICPQIGAFAMMNRHFLVQTSLSGRRLTRLSLQIGGVETLTQTA